jgi:hypothetical protein
VDADRDLYRDGYTHMDADPDRHEHLDAFVDAYRDIHADGYENLDADLDAHADADRDVHPDADSAGGIATVEGGFTEQREVGGRGGVHVDPRGDVVHVL